MATSQGDDYGNKAVAEAQAQAIQTAQAAWKLAAEREARVSGKMLPMPSTEMLLKWMANPY